MQDKQIAFGDTTLIATRLTLLGNDQSSTFKVKDAAGVTSADHPFGSFRAQGRVYYVHGPNITDEKFRKALTFGR